MTDIAATGSLAGTERLDRQSLFLLFIGLFATAIGQAFVFAILPPRYHWITARVADD